MKVIYPNKITAVTADEENASYPDDNTLDDYPKKVWKATSVDSTIKFTVSSGSNAFAIFGSNLSSLVVTIKNTAETVTLVAAQTVNLRIIDTYQDLITDNYFQYTEYWLDYEYQGTAVKIICDCTSPAATVCEIGVASAGHAKIFKDPKYGIRQGYIDTSITRQLSNGAFYYRQRDILRTFSGELLLDRIDFWSWTRKVTKEIGVAPMAWRITEDETKDWTVYGRLDEPVSGSHDYTDKTSSEFSIIEVV